jgi:hypothetical protein
MNLLYYTISIILFAVSTIHPSDVPRDNIGNLPSMTTQGLVIPWRFIWGSVAVCIGYLAIKYGWQKYQHFYHKPPISFYLPGSPTSKSKQTEVEAKQVTRKSWQQEYRKNYITATNAFLRAKNWARLANNQQKPNPSIDSIESIKQYSTINNLVSEYQKSYLTQVEKYNFNIDPVNEMERVKLVSELFKNYPNELEEILTNNNQRFCNIVLLEKPEENKMVQFNIIGNNKGISCFGILFADGETTSYGCSHESHPCYKNDIFSSASTAYFDAYYDLYKNVGPQKIYDRRLGQSRE